MLLERLYDSHVHLMATGQLRRELDLSTLSCRDDLQQILDRPFARRGDWIVGFGWDETKWKNPTLFDRDFLDAIFPDQPVLLSRCDGHSACLNSVALHKLGWTDGSSIDALDFPSSCLVQDKNGRLSGVIRENALTEAFSKLPPPTTAETQDSLLSGIEVFHRAGFTHLRDMGGDLQQWQAAAELESQDRWKISVDWNFVAENLNDYARILQDLTSAKQSQSRRRRVGALKFYLDGSLGSDTAWISQDYVHLEKSTRGLQCWPEALAEEALIKSWEKGFDVAVHVIGDEAVDRMVEVARRVSSRGLAGRLHLEHVEIIRPETIQKMKSLHLVCHLQPCHWLSDRRWLKEKLGSLAQHAFPWGALAKAKIPVSFGSDSPIEKPSYFENLRALAESEKAGIPAFPLNPIKAHTHPDLQTELGRTWIENDRIERVEFAGEVVFKAESSASQSPVSNLEKRQHQ